MLCDGQTFAPALLPSFRANHTLLSPNKSHTSLILPCLYLSANCSLTFQLTPLPLWPIALNFVTTHQTSDLPQDLFLISTSFPFAVWKLSTIWPTWLNTALQFAVIHTYIHLFTCLQSACMINHCGSSPLPSLHFPSSFVHSILLQHFFFNRLAKHLTLAVRLGLHEILPHPAYLLCVLFFLYQDKKMLQPVRETVSSFDFLLSRTSLLAAPSSPGKLHNWLLVPSVTPWHNLSLPTTFVKHQRSSLKCHVCKIEFHISKHLVFFRAWRPPSCGNSSSGTHRLLPNPERRNDQRALGGILRNGFGPNVASRNKFLLLTNGLRSCAIPRQNHSQNKWAGETKNRIAFMCVYLRTGIRPKMFCCGTWSICTCASWPIGSLRVIATKPPVLPTATTKCKEHVVHWTPSGTRTDNCSYEHVLWAHNLKMMWIQEYGQRR